MTQELTLGALPGMPLDTLRLHWQRLTKTPAPGVSAPLLRRALTYRLHVREHGDLSPEAKAMLASHIRALDKTGQLAATHAPPSHGTRLVREWGGQMHEVIVEGDRYIWRGETYASLSVIAKQITGTNWSGPRFFGLKAQRRG